MRTTIRQWLMTGSLMLSCGWPGPWVWSEPASPQAATPGVASSLAKPEPMPGGQLLMMGPDGSKAGVCPLKRTSVDAEISGFVGHVKVRQTFDNPSDKKIEAVYVFPLPGGAAIDGMTMVIGKRRIEGQIQSREQARAIYEAARAAGKVASLLDQERPNVFTQSLANLEPHARVEVEISYIEGIKLEDGVYEWVLPTVVGPRFAPGNSGHAATDDAAATVAVKTAPPRTRDGHTLSVKVHLDPGMELHDVASPSHEIVVTPLSGDGVEVTLADQETIPNRDFILRYRTATEEIGDAFLTHSDSRGDYFTLVLQPPRRVAPATVQPRELIFVIDRSGSMSGAPLEKAKQAMRRCIEGATPRDTFNLMSFSFGPESCFDDPVPATPANLKIALAYLESLHGEGGTDLVPVVQAAFKSRPDDHRLRIVCLMTDGYVDNDFAVIDAVKNLAGDARIFAFGIGSAVNRHLLDGIATAGRGDVQYVTLGENGDEAAKKFYSRIDAPVLTHISIDWGGLPVSEVYPKLIPDLWSAKALTIHGRFDHPAAGTITVRGLTGAGAFERRVAVGLPVKPEQNEAIASLWARAKVADLMTRDMLGLQYGTFSKPLRADIVSLGMDYHLLTQFTSFVAVDNSRVTEGGPAERVNVLTPLPHGVTGAGPARVTATASRIGIAPPATVTVAPAMVYRSGTATYRAVPGHPLYARAGDPLMSVRVPADARQVIAIMPGGDIKRLAYNADSNYWEAAFDIPTYATDGPYDVVVIIVLKDGTRQELKLQYHVLTTAAAGIGRASLLDGNMRVLQLSIDASEDTERVVALLPWGERVPLPRRSPHLFQTSLPLPAGILDRVQNLKVTYVLTNRSHNRTIITIDNTTAGATP